MTGPLLCVYERRKYKSASTTEFCSKSLKKYFACLDEDAFCFSSYKGPGCGTTIWDAGVEMSSGHQQASLASRDALNMPVEAPDVIVPDSKLERCTKSY